MYIHSFEKKFHVPFCNTYTVELLKTKAWHCWGEVCLGKGLFTYYMKSYLIFSNSWQGRQVVVCREFRT